MESTSYVLSFRMVFFYLVTTGSIFYISLCENSINETFFTIVSECGGEGRTKIGPSGFLNFLGSTRYSNCHEHLWPCDGGLSVVNAIGRQLRDPINTGLTQWRLTVWMGAVAASGSRRGHPNLSREIKFSGANGDMVNNFPRSAHHEQN